MSWNPDFGAVSDEEDEDQISVFSGKPIIKYIINFYLQILPNFNRSRCHYLPD